MFVVPIVSTNWKSDFADMPGSIARSFNLGIVSHVDTILSTTEPQHGKLDMLEWKNKLLVHILSTLLSCPGFQDTLYCKKH